MSQESLRSSVYRSFVTCDDPKGVAECKTIRRSKEKKTPKIPQDEEELQNLSSFQIMEVSRGADKLNQVVDSWSSGKSVDYRAKNVARDLLQGALHLQDSLLVLSRLQQAKKMSSGEFSSRSLLPSDRQQTTRDCYDDLREVIRESFARQKILSGKELEDVSSSSGSRSSLICYHSSNTSPPEKAKGPNLIARLMGLDEAPSRQYNLLSFKQTKKEKEKEKFSSLVEIDLHRAKKAQVMGVKEKTTLEDMVETMESKGHLGRKKDSFDDSRKSSAVDDPPIVIMKPLRRRENEEKHISKSTTTSMLHSPRKKKLDKYTEDRLSEKSEPKKAQDTKDRVKMNHSKPPVPRMPKKESVVSKIDDDKPKKESVGRKIDDEKSKKESVGRKIDDDKPKIAHSTRKPKDAKCQVSGKIQVVGKKLSTLKRGSCVSKGQNAARNESFKRASIESSIPNKNLGKARPKNKPSPSLVENVPSVINIETNIQGEEAINPCNVSISDNASPCESFEPISKDVVNEDNGCTPSRCSDKSEDCESKTNTRRLLLSSASFLNHVEEELFNTVTCVDDSDDKEVVDDPLLLDCAKELLTRKSLRCKNARMVSASSLDDKSIQELVGEICDGIECLRDYSKTCGDVLEDSIYPMLERDLWCNEEVIGIWDLGWRRDGYTMEDMMEVVHDIEKLVLSEFLDDVIVEFMQ